MYAGAYAFGKTESRTKVIDGRARKSDGHFKSPEAWMVLIRDHQSQLSFVYRLKRAPVPSIQLWLHCRGREVARRCEAGSKPGAFLREPHARTGPRAPL
jgi:hypothetical protein